MVILFNTLPQNTTQHNTLFVIAQPFTHSLTHWLGLPVYGIHLFFFIIIAEPFKKSVSSGSNEYE